MARRWQGTIMVEGKATGDGRYIEPGALRWATPPLPLTWQKASADGHDGEVVVGSIDSISRADDGRITGSGTLLDTPEANEVASLIDTGVVGLSASLDDATEYIVPVDENGVPIPDSQLPGLLLDPLGDPAAEPAVEPQLRVSDARVRNAAIVTTPAFVECEIHLVGDTAPAPAPAVPAPAAAAATADFSTLVAGAIAPHTTGTSDGPWDGAAQEAKLSSPMSLDTARRMYAWYDDAAVTNGEIAKAGAKFPHHEVGANAAPGVANLTAASSGIAALHGGRTPTTIPQADQQGVYNHLAGHLRDAGRTPPAFDAVIAGACCLACQANLPCEGATAAASAGDRFTPPRAVIVEARQFLAWRRSGRVGGSPLAATRATDLAAGLAVPYAVVKRLYAFFARHETHRDDDGWRSPDASFPSPGRVAWAAHGGDAGLEWARSVIVDVESEAALVAYADVAGSLIASSATLKAPPRSWFADPHLDGPTPLTVTAEGRVFGHLAPWTSCHMAVGGTCLTPPRTTTGYAHFHQGRVHTDDGTIVPTGKITLDTTHATLDHDARGAVEHYEHSGRVVADIAAGDDAYGIWIAGALRPSVSVDDRLALERSGLSGDWRRVGAGLELIAALAVNVPGFPIVGARATTAAAGPAALVASGVVEADRRDRARAGHRHHDPRLEGAAEALAATIGRDRRSKVAALVADVHGSR
jgi:hypothetical protein